MPKNSKNEATNGSAASEPSAPVENAAPRAKKSAKSGSKKPARKVAAKKAGAKTAAKSSPATKAAAPAVKASEPTDAEISLRAYFLAEKRLQQHLPGDQAHDWLEARRQLRAEAGLA